MKKYYFIFFSLICNVLHSQSPDCINAEPFCTGTTATCAASTNTQAPLGPDYDSLFTQPTPAFYYIQIDQPGNITITIQSTTSFFRISRCQIDRMADYYNHSMAEPLRTNAPGMITP